MVLLLINRNKWAILHMQKDSRPVYKQLMRLIVSTVNQKTSIAQHILMKEPLFKKKKSFQLNINQRCG